MKSTIIPHFRKNKLPLFFALLFSLSSFISYSQDSPMFVIVEYMKTKPGKEWNYVELERNFWKPVHQQRIKNGEIIAWQLYHIRYTGASDPYNYATVTIFNDPEKLENPWTVDPMTVHPDKDIESIYEETEESRELVITNLLLRENYVQMPQDAPDPKFIEVDYMKVEQGKDGAYLNVEDKVWKPIHQQFINAGTRAGWSVWGRIYPSGYGLDYQYLTVNDFAEFSQIGKADYVAAAKAAHPKEDMDTIGKETNNSRELVKSELWELLDVAY